MEKVAVYCRVSTEEQAQRQTIENQVDYAKDYCQREGYIIYDLYCDDGISGTIPFEEREAGRRLLNDAKEGKFNLVLIWKIDRLARDTRLALTVAHILKDLGVSIKSMTEPFDTSTPIGEFMFTQLASIAKLERDNIRERSITGTNRVAKQGKWLGGIVPYGYRVNEEGYLEINETPLPGSAFSEAEVIRMIYNWIGRDGLSCIEVAKRLNSMGIPTHYAKDSREFILPPQNTPGKAGLKGKRKVKTSGRWHPHRIGNMVRNTTYMGIHIYGKRSKGKRELIERQVPAIVPPELWHKAQETLKNNFFWAKRNSKREYLLRGLIKCGICGRSMVGSFYKGRKSEHERWYRCSGKFIHVRVAKGTSCPSRAIKAEWIESLVWGELKGWILHSKTLDQILSEELDRYERERGNWFIELGRLKAELNLKTQERERIMNLYRKGIIRMRDVESQMRQIEEEEKELECMIGELKAKMTGDISREEIIRSIKERLEEFKERIERGRISFQEKRKIIESFVKEIRVNLQGEYNLVETIPWKEGFIKEEPPENTVRKAVYVRVGEVEPVIPEGEINIIYRFAIPSKPDLITYHTGMDS